MSFTHSWPIDPFITIQWSFFFSCYYFWLKFYFIWFKYSSLQFSHSVMSDLLRPHGLKHASLPCPSPTPGACSNSYPSSRWCHPTISSSDWETVIQYLKEKKSYLVKSMIKKIEEKVHKSCISVKYRYTSPTTCSLVTGLWWQRCSESPISAVKWSFNPCHCSVHFFKRPQIIILMGSILQ